MQIVETQIPENKREYICKLKNEINLIQPQVHTSMSQLTTVPNAETGPC